MEILVSKNKWNLNRISNMVTDNGDNTIINNSTNQKLQIEYREKIVVKDKAVKSLKLRFFGHVENAGGCLYINGDHSVPINSEIEMEIVPPINLTLTIVISSLSSITLSDLKIELFEEKPNSVIHKLDKKNDVLVIVPSYPSYESLYSCAFAHSRTKEYVKAGLNVQVACIQSTYWYHTIYERDGVPVFKGNHSDLKEILSTHQYKTIVVHFVDDNLYPLFDGNIIDENLIFICHGPETVYRYLVDVTKPYFTKSLVHPWQCEEFDLKDKYVKKYAKKSNVTWVFVSEWLKNYSQEQQQLEFGNSVIINNIIDEDLFPYCPKTEDDRKKILVIRKFDNISQHSIDQTVLAILELSRKEYFDDLTFEIYGDGNYFDELIAPITNFDNIHIHRTFVPNEKICEIHKQNGILLLPSRHDAHAVAMGEGASSGMVVVGSTVTSNSYFMNEKENHTLADAEDFHGLVEIIERLYQNPDEFLEISKRMSEFTRQFSKENTVAKEIALIKEKLHSPKQLFVSTKEPSNNPVLTIGVPAYNVEKYIEKCLFSIIDHKNSHKTEVLVINDGSTDNTAVLVEKIAAKTNGIVKLISQENGGHGAAINTALKYAAGKYFRLIDGDDWVDSENLSKLIDIMEVTESDIILTKGSYDYIGEPKLVNIISYDQLHEGTVYCFDDLTYDNYGFSTYGPLLTTGNYKTDTLKKANFSISEKKPYVDMEFNAFSLKCVETLEYHDLDIYRYLIGREGQTISRDFWQKKYRDHEYIIFSILDEVSKNSDYTDRKTEYINKHIIGQMVDSQIFMYDALCLWERIDPFFKKLKTYDNAYDNCINIIKKNNGNCWLILNLYKKKLKHPDMRPIVIPGVIETLDGYYQNKKLSYRIITFLRKIKNKLEA